MGQVIVNGKGAQAEVVWSAEVPVHGVISVPLKSASRMSPGETLVATFKCRVGMTVELKFIINCSGSFYSWYPSTCSFKIESGTGAEATYKPIHDTGQGAFTGSAVVRLYAGDNNIYFCSTEKININDQYARGFKSGTLSGNVYPKEPDGIENFISDVR